MIKRSKQLHIDRDIKCAQMEIFNNQNMNFQRQLAQMLENLSREPYFLERIAVKSAEEILIVKVKDIDWIQPSGNYLHLHAGKSVHVWRGTINGLESKLNPRQFLRIHRSVIVNVEQIRKIYPLFRGEYEFILEDNTRLTSSRAYRDRLQQAFGRKF
jgi:two-component system LytT family response regulator